MSDFCDVGDGAPRNAALSTTQAEATSGGNALNSACFDSRGVFNLENICTPIGEAGEISARPADGRGGEGVCLCVCACVSVCVCVCLCVCVCAFVCLCVGAEFQ